MVTTLLCIAALLCSLVWAFLKWGTGVEHFWGKGGYTLSPNVTQAGPQKRRTGRLSLAVPIQVTGLDVRGDGFEEETHTKDISGYGASILLSRQLRPGQEIVISRDDKSRTATCRVVYEMERREGSHLYGVAFVDPSADIWGVCNLLTEAMGTQAKAKEG